MFRQTASTSPSMICAALTKSSAFVALGGAKVSGIVIDDHYDEYEGDYVGGAHPHPNCAMSGLSSFTVEKYLVLSSVFAAMNRSASIILV